MRICKKCGKEKDEKDFRIQHCKKWKKGYLCSYCKECEAFIVNKSEKSHEYKARWRLKESSKKYFRESMKKWRLTTKGLENIKRNNQRRKDNGWVYMKKWRKTEKGIENRKRNAAKYRAKFFNNNTFIITLTSNQWKQILEMFNFRCAYCGSDIKMRPTQDHVIPISKGGTHTIDNIVPACQSCNSSKKDQIWEPKREWIN